MGAEVVEADDGREPVPPVVSETPPASVQEPQMPILPEKGSSTIAPWEGGSPAPALYTLRLGGLLGPEYAAAAQDVLRTVVIQVVVQMLVSASDEGTPFFSGIFWLLILYIIIGTIAYHLFVRRIVRIVP